MQKPLSQASVDDRERRKDCAHDKRGTTVHGADHRPLGRLIRSTRNEDANNRLESNDPIAETSYGEESVMRFISPLLPPPRLTYKSANLASHIRREAAPCRKSNRLV